MRHAKIAVLSLVAPTYAVWREAITAHPAAGTPFRRLGAKPLRWEVALLVTGAAVAGAGAAMDIGLVTWIGLAWLAAAGFKVAARFVVPTRRLSSEEQFQAVFSLRGLVRVAVLVLLVRAVVLANWFGASVLGLILITLWVQGLVPVLLFRWLESRRQSHGNRA